MLNYIAKRLVSAIIVILGVSSIVFFMIHIIPGDPVEVMLGESATASDREHLRRQLGLDLPIYQQWFGYLHGLANLDLGISLHSQRPVGAILLERIPITFLLALSAIMVAMCIALPLGILSALNKDTVYDQASLGLAMLGVAIPNFWLGPLLVLVFSFYLGWFPISGIAGPASLVLPAVTLGTALA
ncbi:MAG: ABC transporter permease, partial [Thiotrichales bacterium]|nr:ABC transporter permease [Thiotrichales bacterium]